MSNKKQWCITKNIAQIRLDLQTVLNDLEYQNSGWHILYGVDNDVIKLYSNPEEKRKYARSFDDENEKNLITNAYSLAEYIFKYLSEEPLLTLPTLYTESTYIFEYIWNSASMAHTVKKHQLIILKNLFKNYQKTQDLNQLVEDMLKHCDVLCCYFSHDILSSSNAEIELQRISHLVKSNRLVNIQKKQWQQALPSHGDLIVDSKNWYDKLRDNHPKKPLYNLLDDAKTLAYVALINRSFKKSGIKQKLYLITGDSGIHEVLASEPMAMEEIPVRHPRMYRAFIKLFDYSGSKEELLQGLQEYRKLLDDFLSPFLLSCNGDEQAYLSDLSSIVKNEKVEKFKFLSDNVEIATYNKIKANRSELYNIAALNQNIINNQEQLKLWLQKFINKDQSPQTDLLIDIEELLKQKWDSAYDDLKRIYIGIGTVNMRILEQSLDLHHEAICDGRQQGWQSQPIPLVSFGIDGKMDDFFENIRNALREENPKYATILRLLNPNEMYSIGKLYLVSALIATEACVWEQVKEFCKSALEKAIEDPNTQHEAYYFQAIAIRHHCLNCKEYREAVDSLRKAEAIWKENHEELSNSVESLRFQVERCNQIMAYYNYKRFIIVAQISFVFWPFSCLMTQAGTANNGLAST